MLTRGLDASSGVREQLGLIVLDIDHFKRINDTYGHDAGDSMLVTVSQVIRNSIREQDSASRWGGEEFLIVLPDTDLDGAVIVAERIRKQIAAIKVLIEKQAVIASVTLGVSSFCAGESISSAIARADASLYQGKKTGRNRVVPALSAEA